MKALILAAGYGTRLYPLTQDTPKALLPVKGRPVIEYLVGKLESLSENKILVATNNRFFPHFKDWINKANLRYSLAEADCKTPVEIINDYTNSEHDKLGAIGEIDYVVKLKNIKEDLLIVAGDNLFDFELDKFIDFSQVVLESKYPTVGIINLEHKKLVSRYGVVKLNKNNRIIEFKEKPKCPTSSLVAVGIYFFPARALFLISKYLEEGNNPDTPGYLIEWLCKNDVVYGYVFSGRWYDIGSVEGYRRAGGDDEVK